MIPKSGYRFSDKIMPKTEKNAGPEFSEAEAGAKPGVDE
jgi:hypothetical protein